MISSEMNTLYIKTKTYQQLIDQGKKLVRVDCESAIFLYKEAQSLIDDKFDTYVLQAQARSMNGSQELAVNNLSQALDFIYGKKDRLFLIACEFEKLQLTSIAQYVHELIKDGDSTQDNVFSQSYDDQEQIVIQFFSMKEFNYPLAKLIDKLISLSQIKQETFLLIGSLILINSQLKSNLLQQAENYFKLAMSINDGIYDKHDILIRIGGMYLKIIPDISIKYFDLALSLKPNLFPTHTKIVMAKIEQALFRQAFEYIKNQQIPNEINVYLGLGILFSILKWAQHMPKIKIG